MQVVCPEGAVAGGQMVVNVPVSAVVQPSQCKSCSQWRCRSCSQLLRWARRRRLSGTTVVEQPMMMAADRPQPQVMATPPPHTTAPPQPQAMARAPMEGRVEEIELGCYGQQGAPCCWLMSLSWKDSDRTVITRARVLLLLLHRLLPGLLRRHGSGKRQREFQSANGVKPELSVAHLVHHDWRHREWRRRIGKCANIKALAHGIRLSHRASTSHEDESRTGRAR